MVRPNLVRSTGLAFIFIPVTMVALSDVPAAQRGNATGLFNLTRELVNRQPNDIYPEAFADRVGRACGNHHAPRRTQRGTP